DRARLRREVAHLAHRIEAVRLRDPHQVEAGRLELLDALDIGVEVAGVVDHHRELHERRRYAPGPPTPEPEPSRKVSDTLRDPSPRRARCLTPCATGQRERGGSGKKALVRSM